MHALPSTPFGLSLSKPAWYSARHFDRLSANGLWEWNAAPLNVMKNAALTDWLDRQAGRVFILPAVIVILGFSLFPMLISAWLSLTRFSLESGGYALKFIGAANYRKLLTGSEQFHFLGTEAEMPAWGWLVLLLAVALFWPALKRALRATAEPASSIAALCLLASSTVAALVLAPISPWHEAIGEWQESLEWSWSIWLLAAALLLLASGAIVRAFSGRHVSLAGLFGRQLACTLWLFIALLICGTVGAGGQQGSLVTTLFYVIVGVSLQFAIGLTLALLCAQPIRARNFFRLSFFIPLMVTPVGIAYMFRMMADMSVGPLAPIARWLGLGANTWAEHAWSARWVVLVGDTWQWVPFIFIVMLAAVEGQPRDQLEAAQLDGASGWRILRDITWPSIAPTAAAVVLIRLIEAFKIVDLPNVLTNGGPGIATESLTLHAFIDWRTLNLGGSAAVSYMLLFISTISAVSYFHFVVRRARGET